MIWRIKSAEESTLHSAAEGMQAAIASLCALDGGGWALLFREAPARAAANPLHGHIHPESRTAMIEFGAALDAASAKPVEIPDQQPGAGNAPALHPLGGGKYMFIDWRRRFYPEGERPIQTFKIDDLSIWAGPGDAFTREATHGTDGWSFGPERPVPAGPRRPLQSCNSAIVRPGEILAPFYCVEENQLFDNETILMRTADGGATWEETGRLERRERRNDRPLANLLEASVADSGEGTLTALIRTTNKFDYLLGTYSEDGGKTWPMPERTEIQGHPAHILPLGGGAMICASATSIKRRAVRLCLSRDGGKTWDTDNILELASGLPEGDFGFPFLAPHPAGGFICACHVQDETSRYHIRAVRFEVEV